MSKITKKELISVGKDIVQAVHELTEVAQAMGFIPRLHQQPPQTGWTLAKAQEELAMSWGQELSEYTVVGDTIFHRGENGLTIIGPDKVIDITNDGSVETFPKVRE
jgi:hypothetical protein